MDYRRTFAVEPRAKAHLLKTDPAYTVKRETHENAESEIQQHADRMARPQYPLYVDGNQPLLVVLQGLDAAGRDRVIRQVFSGINPQRTFVCGFEQPSKYEAAHDFSGALASRTHAERDVVIFSRSYYEAVLVVRVHKLTSRVKTFRHDKRF